MSDRELKKLLTDPEAMYVLGCHYLTGHRARRADCDAAAFWLRHAVERGKINAQCKLARLLIEEKRSYKEGVALVQSLLPSPMLRKCEADDLHQLAMAISGDASLDEERFRLLQFAARKGHPNACHLYACMCFRRGLYKECAEFCLRSIKLNEFPSVGYDLLVECFRKCRPGELDKLKSKCDGLDMEVIWWDRDNPKSMTNFFKRIHSASLRSDTLFFKQNVTEVEREARSTDGLERTKRDNTKRIVGDCE